VNHRRLRLRIAHSPALIFLVLALALGVPLSLWALARSRTLLLEPPRAAAPVSSPALRAPAAAITALGRRDCSTALDALSTITPPAHRHLLTGLYAHACERPDLAREELGHPEAGGGDTAFEDWRLFILADSAAATGEWVTAASALGRLLDLYPDSPLRFRAFVRGLEVAGQRGDGERVRHLLALARQADMPREQAVQLESLAWRLDRGLHGPESLTEAGRRLAALAPEEAESLGVLRELFAPGDRPDWFSFLGADGCQSRAAALLALGRPGEAVEVLEALPEPRRSLAWSLSLARALTADRRGGEALPHLGTFRPRNATEGAAWEWAMAEAKAEAATVRRGRSNLPSPERAALQAEARAHWTRVAGQNVDRELAARALRRLFVEWIEEDRFDDAMAVLARLKRLDAKDRTGARPLFEWGWREYRRRNLTGAVGTWAELIALYPESFDARRGLYWSGRAQEESGHRERARELFLEVAAVDTDDFYRRHAVERLGGEDRDGGRPRPSPPPAPEPWPRDARLARVERLAELGLTDLALSELDAVGPQAEARAAAALRARLLAARGEHRASILALLSAFENLGTARQAGLPEEALRLYYPLHFWEDIEAAARAEGLPPLLVVSMVRQESAFDLTATSQAGARGLMQLMPDTGREVARRLGLPFSPVRLTEPATNVRLGAAYFRQVLDLFDQRLELALAGYNGGPYRIRRLWRSSRSREVDLFIEDLPIPESQSYVRRVLLLMDSYRQLYPATSSPPSPPSGPPGSAR